MATALGEIVVFPSSQNTTHTTACTAKEADTGDTEEDMGESTDSSACQKRHVVERLANMD